MKDVLVVIPYGIRGQPDVYRVRSYDYVYNWYTSRGYTVMGVDDESTPFSRAGSRNKGVQIARDLGFQSVVISDADTYPEERSLELAINRVHNGRLILPYKHFVGLDRASSRKVLSNGSDSERMVTGLKYDLETTWSTGGVLVISPEAYFKAGGQDTRFRGWGYEDTCFRIAADAILGPTERTEGTICSLWHPVSRGYETPLFEESRLLAERYTEAESILDDALRRSAVLDIVNFT